jgi:hypothetical protein
MVSLRTKPERVRKQRGSENVITIADWDALEPRRRLCSVSVWLKQADEKGPRRRQKAMDLLLRELVKESQIPRRHETGRTGNRTLD